MDAQYQHGSTDEAMAGVEDTMNTTPTGGYNNGYQPERRPSIQSPDYPPQNAPFSPNPNADPMPHNASQGYQQQPMQSYPRPSSGLSGSGDRYGHSQQYQEQPPRQAGNNATQSSVVIKVGMVGDAQIGKTSLMVKYVEGSWDEDYIQTLGMDLSGTSSRESTTNKIRGQFHGKNHLNTEHRNYFLNLGSWWATRIR